MRLEERLPRHGPSPGRGRLNAVSLEDALNGRAAEGQTHVLEGATKSRAPPRWIVARHGDHLLDRIARRASPAGARTRRRPVVFGSDLLPVPTQDGFGPRERRHLDQPRASKRPAFFREKPAFGVGESQTLGPYVGLEVWSGAFSAITAHTRLPESSRPVTIHDGPN
jgi:hypothetical protein